MVVYEVYWVVYAVLGRHSFQLNKATWPSLQEKEGAAVTLMEGLTIWSLNSVAALIKAVPPFIVSQRVHQYAELQALPGMVPCMPIVFLQSHCAAMQCASQH